MSFNTEQLSVVRTQGDDLVHYCKYQTLDRDKMVVVRILRLCSHSVPGSFFVAQQKAVRYIYLLSTATARGGTSRSHTSNIVPAWLAERAWCPVLTSEYFFVSAGSSPRTNLVTKVVTLHQSRAQNLSDI